MKYLIRLLLMLLWIPVALVKFVLFCGGVVFIPFYLWFDLTLPKVWRGTPGRPYTYVELAWRNYVDGFKYLIPHPPTSEYDTIKKQTAYWVKSGESIITFDPDFKMESADMVANDAKIMTRWRRYKWMISYRRVVIISSKRYLEIYVGWKLMSAPPDLDFGTSVRIGKIGN